MFKFTLENFYKRIIFMILFFVSVYLYRNYFKYNDKIDYIDVDVSNNQKLVDIIKQHGTKKDPKLNFNKSSCHVLNFYDISKNCPEYIDKFYDPSFIETIKNKLDLPNLEIISPEIDPLGFAMHLYCENDFMEYHFDTNFTLGTRYSVVIPLYLNQENNCYLQIKDQEKKEKQIKIDIGKAVVYNGDKVLHCVTPQCKNGERITLVLNLTTTTKTNFIGDILQKARNYMFKKYTW